MYSPLHLSEPFSRRIGWNPLFWLEPISQLLPFWVELCCAKYFPLYCLESIFRRIGRNQFPVVLLFPLYWLEPISRRICLIFLEPFPPYWVDFFGPFHRDVFPAKYVRTCLEPTSRQFCLIFSEQIFHQAILLEPIFRHTNSKFE